MVNVEMPAAFWVAFDKYFLKIYARMEKEFQVQPKKGQVAGAILSHFFLAHSQETRLESDETPEDVLESLQVLVRKQDLQALGVDIGGSARSPDLSISVLPQIGRDREPGNF